jgi:hypothetical protein
MRLGEIHEWLYHKIVLQEKLEEDIVRWANRLGLPASEWMEEVINQYGEPTGAKPLKKVIDKSNIHGWLHARVDSTEYRQAALLTRILKDRPDLKEKMKEIYVKHAESAAGDYQGALPASPEEIYIIINDYVLDGMPTERVNEVLSGNENVIIWRTSICLHQRYWDEVEGDVVHYYDFREAWIKSFVETLTPQFSYERRPNGDHKIVRK